MLESDLTILDDIERLVDEDSRGDPESLLRESDSERRLLTAREKPQLASDPSAAAFPAQAPAGAVSGLALAANDEGRYREVRQTSTRLRAPGSPGAGGVDVLARLPTSARSVGLVPIDHLPIQYPGKSASPVAGVGV